MTTNKPEVVAYATHHDEPMLFPSMKEAAAYCEDEEEPVALIRLSDYEALQAENERLRSILIDLKDWDCDVSGGFLSIPLHLRRRMQDAIDAQALRQDADPCPQCIPGGVCKTPTCGRLLAAQVQPDAGLDVEAVLTELLNRIAASHGAPVLIGADELADWPAEAVAAMQSQGVITRARPAVSAVCPGCERECVMPVYSPTGAGHAAGAFIVCDKRSDINRVPIPVSRLEQWQVSGDSIADSLARLLDLHRSGADTASEGRWEIGIFKGSKHAGQLVLVADGKLTLSIAGHFIPLASVLTLDESGLKADMHVLLREMDGDDLDAAIDDAMLQARKKGGE